MNDLIRNICVGSISIFFSGCISVHRPVVAQVTMKPHFEGAHVDIADLDEMPRLLTSVSPAYPPDLRADHISGTALIVFVLSVSGEPTQIQCVTATDARFAHAAIAAVSRFRYTPGVRQGKPVACTIFVPMEFNYLSAGKDPESLELTQAGIMEITRQLEAVKQKYLLVSVVEESGGLAKVTLASKADQRKALLMYFEMTDGKWIQNESKTKEAIFLIP